MKLWNINKQHMKGATIEIFVIWHTMTYENIYSFNILTIITVLKVIGLTVCRKFDCISRIAVFLYVSQYGRVSHNNSRKFRLCITTKKLPINERTHLVLLIQLFHSSNIKCSPAEALWEHKYWIDTVSLESLPTQVFATLFRKKMCPYPAAVCTVWYERNKSVPCLLHLNQQT